MSYNSPSAELSLARGLSRVEAGGRATHARFGPFTFDLKAGELCREGCKTILQSQPHKILLMLVKHPGEVVSRQEIQQRLWPDGVIVSYDVSISQAVSKLRRALNDSASRPQYIETVGRRGYRLKIPVTVGAPTSVATANGRTVRNSAPVEAGSTTGVVVDQDERKALAEVLRQLLQLLAYVGSSLQQPAMSDLPVVSAANLQATKAKSLASVLLVPGPLYRAG